MINSKTKKVDEKKTPVKY